MNPLKKVNVKTKKGQSAGSKKHSDLYTDENPKGTIHGLKFATVADAKASVSKIRNSEKTRTQNTGGCCYGTKSKGSRKNFLQQCIENILTQ